MVLDVFDVVFCVPSTPFQIIALVAVVGGVRIGWPNACLEPGFNSAPNPVIITPAQSGRYYEYINATPK